MLAIGRIGLVFSIGNRACKNIIPIPPLKGVGVHVFVAVNPPPPFFRIDRRFIDPGTLCKQISPL